jgi:phosphatidylglycerophosphatase A
MKRTIEALATGFYVGKIRFMPGTWGTLWGLPLAWLLARFSPITYMLGAAFVLLVAIAVAELYEIHTQAHDLGEVVIDEVVGMVIALTWLPQTWQAYLAGFLLFRFFDILKPPPIRQIDQRIRGGVGTVLDDVAAGLAANVILQIVYTQTTWLGVKLQYVS